LKKKENMRLREREIIIELRRKKTKKEKMSENKERWVPLKELPYPQKR